MTVLYRINGGEVLKISLTDQPFADRDQTYFGVLQDPPLPDGNATRETLPDGTLGPLRVLGFAKIWDGSAVRNATQPEIDGFQALESADESSMDRDRAEEIFLAHPTFRKVFVALADILVDEFNGLRAWITDYKAEVEAATSLANLKARVAAMPNLNDRNLAQFKAAIVARLSPGD